MILNNKFWIFFPLLDIGRQPSYHHEYNSVRNELFPQHSHSHLSHHRHHPYATVLEQHHRFTSQQPTVVQYHQQQQQQQPPQQQQQTDMTSIGFDAELCAREIVTSPLSSTGSSITNNAANGEEHHSTIIPTISTTAASTDSQP